MPTIAQAIAYGRRALNQMEPALVRALLDQYGIAWLHIERRLSEVEGMITAAIARGEMVDDRWLQRQAWWDSTLRSIEVEMQRYTRGMAQTIALGEMQAVGVARTVTSSVAEYVTQEAAKRGISVQGGIRGQVNPGAMERWMLAQQPDSPVRKAIDAYGDRVSTSVRTQMTEGLAAGEHPRTIAKNIIAEVGPEASEGRIHTITRTETHRAYRGAAADSFAQMEKSGAIMGYRWLAARGPRACAACIAMDGKFFEKYPTNQHVACRCTVQPVPNPDLVPARPVRVSGEEWLKLQDTKTQRRILGPGRYDAWKEGVPLDDMVGTRHSEVWGDSIRVKSLKEIRAEKVA